MKKLGKKTISVLTILIVTIAMMLAFLARWVMATWANLKMDELMFQLSMPTKGTEAGIVKSGLIQVGIPTLVVLVVMILLFIRTRKMKKRILLVLTCACFAFSTVFVTKDYVWKTLAVDQYFENRKTDSTYIKDNYVNPSKTVLTFPEQKRNLIYIFLESMETTYADQANGGAFDVNVIPELTEISQNNENFSGNTGILNGGYSTTSTTWTIAAMCAQTSGLPLKTGVGQNEMDKAGHFFSRMENLGDILEENGYSNTLLIGSDATFGGRRLFFTEHGNYDIRDYLYAQEVGWIDPDYLVWWGYEDAKLFENAKETLNELSQQDQPFNLTMLTVDTHFEDGYYCEDCWDEFGDRYSDVMACSSRKVAAFLDWCSEQPWYDNTTIIISGDHPTMDSDFCEDVPESYTRRTYLAILNSAVTPETDEYRTFTTMDMFPTTLAAMGVQIEGNRLGLGTNLFSGEQTLIERDGAEFMDDELAKQSQFMKSLTDIQLEEDTATN